MDGNPPGNRLRSPKESNQKKLRGRMALPLSAQSYYTQIESDLWRETLQSDPVYLRFRYRNFVSKSKGRGRKRKHWKEIELVNDANKGLRRWFTWKRYPFDDAATETCGYVENPTEYLMRRIPQICKE